MDAKLKEVIDLLYSGKREAAQRTLMTYIQRQPKAADAWYLLSWAANTPEERRKAIYRALSLAPDEPRYQKRMAKLQLAAPARKKTPGSARGKKNKVGWQSRQCPSEIGFNIFLSYRSSPACTACGCAVRGWCAAAGQRCAQWSACGSLAHPGASAFARAGTARPDA